MSCSPFDLKDYFFGELPEPARGQVESHLSACTACREELAGLDLTRAALLAVPDEEPPRRIAFVSDKVFEPRWWQRIWSSNGQLGFAAAAMLAVAILAHGVMVRPAVSSPAVATAAPVQNEADIAQRVQVEVAKAVAASEERHLTRTLQVVDSKLKEARREQREGLLMIRDYLERVDKKNSMIRRTMYDR